MGHLIFEWDSNKDIANQRKHNISFDEAKSVFSDPYGRLILDPDHTADEDRFVILGNSIHSRLLVVCHCIRTNESIRIISARKADRQERNIYEEFNHA